MYILLTELAYKYRLIHERRIHCGVDEILSLLSWYLDMYTINYI